MQVKYKAIRERLKKHIEDSNGEGTWKKYYGSQLEADIVRFAEKEVKNYDLLHNVSNQRELLIAFSEWWINVEKPITCNHKNIVDKYLSNL